MVSGWLAPISLGMLRLPIFRLRRMAKLAEYLDAAVAVASPIC